METGINVEERFELGQIGMEKQIFACARMEFALNIIRNTKKLTIVEYLQKGIGLDFINNNVNRLRADVYFLYSKNK